MPLVFKLPRPDVDTAARNAQNLSAWMDDADADCAEEYLISDAGRATWDTYHLIGDVMRTPDLAIVPTPAFSVRMAEAMAAERPHDAALSSRALSRLTWPALLPGLALAAGLALVVWVARPFLTNVDTNINSSVLADARHDNARDNERNSAAAAGLNNYLDAHRQLIGPGVVRQVSFSSTGFRDAGAVRTGAAR